MVVLTDTEIVSVLSEKFDFPLGRIIFGQLDVATNYWIRENQSKPGTRVLPYMSFHRRIMFNPDLRKGGVINLANASGGHEQVDFIPIHLQYVVEIIDGHNIAKGEGGILGQNNYMKKYMLWNGLSPKITISDGVSSHDFRVVAEEPEDNSDLEMSEEGQGFIRSTFNFQVDSIWIDSEEGQGVITDILSRIHLYSGADSDDGSVLISEDHIT